LEKKFKDEEAELRAHPGDWMMPKDPFETSIGHFWGIIATRNYMRARYTYIRSLVDIDTKASLHKQLDHGMDMLRLSRNDNLGVRQHLPSVMIRLNMDQKCYDFVVWWMRANTGEYVGCDKSDLPFLDIKGGDLLENPTRFLHDHNDLHMLTAVTLLKIKVYLDIKELWKVPMACAGRVPMELLDKIKTFIPLSPIVAGNRRLLEMEDHTEILDSLKYDIRLLYEGIDNQNRHFWPAFLNPREHLLAQPVFMKDGSVEEMQVVLQMVFAAWRDVPGAIKFIIGYIPQDHRGHVFRDPN